MDEHKMKGLTMEKRESLAPHDTRKRVLSIISSASGIWWNGMIFMFILLHLFILPHSFSSNGDVVTELLKSSFVFL